jgi:hypothetical protein
MTHQRRVRTAVAVVCGAAALALLLVFVPTYGSGPPTMPRFGIRVGLVGPSTSYHYAVNANFASGSYDPGPVGFNLADVGSAGTLSGLPTGVKGLAWVGTCNGADSSFQSVINSYIGAPHLFGFYLMDEPNPNTCSHANLKAESDYIHSTISGAKTFIIEDDLSSSNHPDYLPNSFAPAGDFNPSNSDIDYYGIDPYPCRSENPGGAPCAYNWINLAVTAASADSIPLADMVPVYQAFGGGTWVDDGGGSYQLPTPSQLTTIISTWGGLLPHPGFDYAYSWGVQNADSALSSQPSLQAVFTSLFTTTTTTTTTTSSSTTTTAPTTTTTGGGSTTSTASTTTTSSTTTTTTVPPTTTTTVPPPPPPPPSAPTGVGFIVAPTGLCVLHWGPPNVTGGLPVTNYTLHFTTSRGGSATASAATPGTTFNGISGETFAASVAAVTIGGQGPYSSPVTCTQP